MTIRAFWRGLAVGAALAGTGCAFEGGAPGDAGAEGESKEQPGTEEVGEVSSALFANEVCPAGAQCFDRTDSTGSIKVRVYRCAWTAASGTPFSRCGVGSAFTLVGGGVEVEGTPQPGHLLTESWTDNGESWIGGSKHHVFGQNNRLRVYAIGIQLNNLTKAKLRPQIKLRVLTSDIHSFPAVAQAVPANEVLLSGGAVGISLNGNGQLLIHSFPTGNTAWASYSKEHLVADPGMIQQVLLSMPVCPTGFSSNPFCVTRSFFFADSSSGGGYRGTTSFVPDNSWIMTGVGAISMSNNNGITNGGRPLTDLFPVTTANGAFAMTKDHSVADAAFTRSFVSAIRRL